MSELYDFLEVTKTYDNKKQRYKYKPSFHIKSPIKDLMVRSKDFFALYNPSTGFWETDESKAIELIDNQIRQYAIDNTDPETMKDPEHTPIVECICNTDNGLIDKWHKFCQKDLRENSKPVNQKIIFSNSSVEKKDYATFALDYPLEPGPTPYYDKLISTLYPDREREKFEWAVGCILNGEQKKIQKMFVFYGEPGSGKSTVINKIIVNIIFGGLRSPYCSKFTAGLLTGRDSFGTGFLGNDPVVAFDDDADLSRIEDSTILNLIVSHEAIRVNEKFKAPFIATPSCLLMCGTNEAVSMKPNSGLNRRLIDIRQTGDKLSPDEYDDVMEHLKFERSGIAWKCYNLYKTKGRNYYNHYQAEDMLTMTSPFHNYVKDNYYDLKDGITLQAAYKLYCDYCIECNFKTTMTRYKFRDELKLYFEEFGDFVAEDGTEYLRFFRGFKPEKIGIVQHSTVLPIAPSEGGWLHFDDTVSLFDSLYSGQDAQYAKSTDGTPRMKWDKVLTKLRNIDTHKLHYVKVPENLIVIDFDIKNENGEKDFALNLEAASKFPPTYAELSKSGAGIHLHYIWTGFDPLELDPIYGDHIEVKVFKGNSALRRQLTKCNNISIAEMNSGLKKKEAKTVITDWKGVEDAAHLRNLIKNDLQKKTFASTKQSVDHIMTVLENAYTSEKFSYDVSDLYSIVNAFALNSTNNAAYCVNVVNHMHFKSKDVEEAEKNKLEEENKVDENAPIIFLDIEIFPDGIDSEGEDNPGLFLVNWKFQGKENPVNRMINPTPDEIRELFKYRIIGFNNRSYDNHMLWARAMGYTNHELYSLSQRIVTKNEGKFREAYNLSYTDVLDFAATKQSLKKWEVQLGIHHLEWSHPWDQPVPKKDWGFVAEYCDNDVISTEAVFDYLHNTDWVARQMLSDFTGLTVNDTTNTLTCALLVGNEPKNYKDEFIYTDLSKLEIEGERVFNGYEFDPKGIDKSHYRDGVKIVSGKSQYKEYDPGEGGFKIAYPGFYKNIWLFDIASMHPHSAIFLKIFGERITKKFEALVEGRVAIKHQDWDKAKLYLEQLAPKEVVEKYLTGTPEELKAMSKRLAYALKIAINSVYGLTSAKFDNKLRDPRNEDNIVAKYGALFMINLREKLQEMGATVVHISTDSIKVANCNEEIANYIFSFGAKYGYTFELEEKFEKMCIVNDAVYIAKVMEEDGRPLEPNERFWTATGKQFQVPYVFKTLFSHEPIIFDDVCEVKSVQKGAMYLCRDGVEKFIGRVGEFTPIDPEYENAGMELLRIDGITRAAVPESKGFLWMESELVRDTDMEDHIDMSFYDEKVEAAKAKISEFVDFDDFVADWTMTPGIGEPEEAPFEDIA